MPAALRSSAPMIHCFTCSLRCYFSKMLTLSAPYLSFESCLICSNPNEKNGQNTWSEGGRKKHLTKTLAKKTSPIGTASIATSIFPNKLPLAKIARPTPNLLNLSKKTCHLHSLPSSRICWSVGCHSCAEILHLFLAIV